MPNFIGQLQGGFNALLGAAAGYKIGQDRKAHQAERERISDEFTERKLKVAESKADTSAKAQALREKEFERKKERDAITDKQKEAMLAVRSQIANTAASKEAAIQAAGTREARAAKETGQGAALQAEAKLTEEQARELGIANTVEEGAITQRTRARQDEYRTQSAQQKAIRKQMQSAAEAAGAKALQNLTEQTEQAEGQKQGLKRREEILNYSNHEAESYVLQKHGGRAMQDYKALVKNLIANGANPEDAEDEAADLIETKYGGKE